MATGRRRSIPESVTVQIIARLPLRSIARFKSVCKQWRSLIESSYFRSLFVSLHRNASSSSSSWSLMFPIKFKNPITEAIGFHGCKTWDLPKSLASYLIPFQLYPNHSTLDYYYIASSNGLVWIEVCFGLDENRNIEAKFFVGNPVTREWVEIHQPQDPSTIATSIVTRVVNGVVSSFKLINTTYEVNDTNDVRSMYVYSSETGAWSFKRIRSPVPLQRAGFNKPLILNGTVYVWDKRVDDGDTAPGVLVAYDFFAEEDDDLLKVWKLKSDNSDGEWWRLTREEIDMASVGFDVDCFPLGVNPFDTGLVYLWSRQHSCVVSGNLRTREFTLREETETWSDGEGSWRVNTSDSKKYMEGVYELNTALVITLSQSVPPQWMDPVPRPPY
ncbi:BnaC06g02950D [Brassica napus]|uniref:BnaC06g02950D protein n=1 Tax=Brassica napus TaxID=3708 RepID=A0A078GSG3_BRANA|nr:BnaC06g02950D [Brassica napus]